jgi:hypothetical protein
MTGQTRRRGPNWLLVTIFLGIALAFFVFSLLPEARRALERYRARAAIAAAAEWNPMVGTELITEPTFEVMDDWSTRITCRYEGESPIAQEDIALYCQLVPIPLTWTLDTCAIDPENPNSYVLAITR